MGNEPTKEPTKEQVLQYRSILMLSANEPAELRAVDVDRVMQEAISQDCFIEFKKWLLSFELKKTTMIKIFKYY